MTTTAATATRHDLGVIREELRRLRCGRGDAGVAAATMNFLVYIDDAAQRRWVYERAVRVADKHPSRLLLLDAADTSEHARVAAASRHGAAGDLGDRAAETTATVHSERVELAVGGLTPAALRSLVQALAVSDVPTIMWWTGRTLGANPHFAGLVALATSVVVDSSGCGAAQTRTLRELGEFCTLGGGCDRVVIHDLAWLRLLPWQDVVAHFFDDLAFMKDLSSIERVEISSGSAPEALYLIGWLGSRLGWTPVDERTLSAPDGRRVAFEWRADGEPRRVRRVAITSAHSRFVAELSDGADAVVLSVDGATERPRAVRPLPQTGNMALIERAILGRRRDAIFASALRTVRQLLG